MKLYPQPMPTDPAAQTCTCGHNRDQHDATECIGSINTGRPGPGQYQPCYCGGWEPARFYTVSFMVMVGETETMSDVWRRADASLELDWQQDYRGMSDVYECDMGGNPVNRDQSS